MSITRPLAMLVAATVLFGCETAPDYEGRQGPSAVRAENDDRLAIVVVPLVDARSARGHLQVVVPGNSELPPPVGRPFTPVLVEVAEVSTASLDFLEPRHGTLVEVFDEWELETILAAERLELIEDEGVLVATTPTGTQIAWSIR